MFYSFFLIHTCLNIYDGLPEEGFGGVAEEVEELEGSIVITLGSIIIKLWMMNGNGYIIRRLTFPLNGYIIYIPVERKLFYNGYIKTINTIHNLIKSNNNRKHSNEYKLNNHYKNPPFRDSWNCPT